MSWLYSRALVEAYLEGTCSDGELFAPSSGNLTPQAYLHSDRMTAFSRPSRFGMTFAPLTENRGAELLTWYREGFHARTSVQQAKARGLPANDPACGQKWRGLLAKYDPASCSWKTAQCLLLEDLEQSLEIWPRWGSMRNEECFQRQALVLHTSESASGLWQTPVADDACNRAAGKWNSRGEPKLSAQVLWATPSATDGTRGGTITENMTGVSLAQMVKTPMRWPTPTAVTDTGGAALCKWGGSGARAQLRKMVTPQELNGALNPTWVEWLMGWPLGWTDLKPLETDRCRSAQQRHGGF